MIEFGCKMIALNPIGYVENRMNIFDGLIVMMTVVDLSMIL